MAKAVIQLPNDFIDKLNAAAKNVDDAAGVVLESGAQILVNQVRHNLSAIIGAGLKSRPRSTGQLVEALGISPVCGIAAPYAGPK